MGNVVTKRFFVFLTLFTTLIFQIQQPVIAMEAESNKEIQEITEDMNQNTEDEVLFQQVDEEKLEIISEEKITIEIEDSNQPVSDITLDEETVETDSNKEETITDEVIETSESELDKIASEEIIEDENDDILIEENISLKSEEETEPLIMMLSYPVMLLNSPKSANAIYVNGVNGDDSKDGSTKENAVKTFAKAKELATNNQGITTIFVTGTISTSGDVSLEGTNAILKREATFNGYILDVAVGKTLTLTNITVDGNSEEAINASSSLVRASGTLNITDGTILQNNKIGTKTQIKREGGAVYSSGGTINMTNGTIQNNTANSGGGIMLRNNAKLNMSGGTIINNQAINGKSTWNDAGAGGGVALYNGGTFNLSGGLIQNNTSEEVGGGISVGTLEASSANNILNMTGGTIDGNTSNATGGGIFIQAAYGTTRISRATITAGNITNNKMLGTGKTNFMFGGGGIYVNGLDASGYKNGELFLDNVVVTNNEAKIQGGGYASCPVSNTKIYVGGAIYGNSKSDSTNDAREIYIYSDTGSWLGAHAGNPKYYISDTMLGGIPYNWKDENNKEVPLNKLSGTLMGDGTELKLHTDSVGNANTLSLAKVFITGNYSETRGGGIGSNGDVTIGKAGGLFNIDVDKTWDDNNNQSGTRPSTIEIELFRKVKGSSDDPEFIGYETMVPDTSGNWSLTINNLLIKDSNGNDYEYSIKERTVSGYKATITGDQTSGFVIDNCKLPNKPTNPINPKTNKENNNPNTETQKDPSLNLYGYVVPNTGDERTVYIWIGILVVAIGGLLIINRKK